MNLFQWHNKFAQHFSELHAQRASGNYPLFAIEHGLSSEELNQLKQAIQNQLVASIPNPESWLPWVVYAAEIGYEFDGHEFWQSFAEKTFNWNSNGDRYFIRDSFRKFVQSFGGFKPSGIWANHFNIISYPITHAILPKDLQRQLAKVLYDLRFQFNRAFLQSTDQLGNKILSRSDGTTKRFQQFSQDTNLTGLIAKALLAHDESEIGNIILPQTLKRIIEDLGREQDAGSWLKEARNIARNRVTRTSKGRSDSEKSYRIKLEPTLILRPTDNSSWDLYIEFPDLLLIAEESTELFDFLTTSRPKIAGSFFDKRLARGRLVSHGSIREKLKTLPNDREDLLVFRREKPSYLEQFLKNEFRLKNLDVNLFKVHNDGLAYQQKSAVFTPGCNYLLLARHIISNNSLTAKQNISGEGIYLYSLVLPKNISNREEDLLTSLGLSVRQGVKISPVGTTAAAWEDSYIEFLADENPCLAIEFDHELESLVLEYADEKINIQNPDLSRPVLINLPQFPIGAYQFTVYGKKRNQIQFEILGDLEIIVREPRTRQAASTNQNVILLFTDPFRPTFEQLFDGKVNFDFWTPPDTIVNLYLTLMNKGWEQNQSFRKKLCSFNLPADADQLNSGISKALQDNGIISKSDDALSCSIEFEAGEFGSVRVNFERELLPLKWNVKADNKNQIHLKLRDYSDSGEKISIIKYDFGFPDQSKTVQYSESSEFGLPIPKDGGLYVAEALKVKQGIVILRGMEQSSFKSFAAIKQNDGFTPQFSKHTRNIETLRNLINLFSLWTVSTSVGSAFRKSDINIVSNALLLEIVSLIGDTHDWEKAEIQYNSGKVGSDYYLQKAVSSKPSLVERLSQICKYQFYNSAEDWVEKLVQILGDEIPEQKTKVNKTGGISLIKLTKQEWFAEFALRLCSRPETLPKWADKKYELGLEKMLAYPVLVKAARFMILTVNRAIMNRNKKISDIWDWE